MRLTAQQDSRTDLKMSRLLRVMFDEKLQDQAVEKEYRLGGHLLDDLKREVDEEISEEGLMERYARAPLN